jgi:hypothetical protein
MKTKQSMNLRIGPWTKKSTANGEVPVYIIINVNGEEKSISPGEKIESIECCDPTLKMVIGNSENAARTNFKIKNAENTFLVLLKPESLS